MCRTLISYEPTTSVNMEFLYMRFICIALRIPGIDDFFMIIAYKNVWWIGYLRSQSRAICSCLLCFCLFQEYNVRACSSNDKNYFIGRFVTGLPSFSKKQSAENKWSIQKEGLQGRQVTDALREKYKNKPWLLEDETGQFQYHGHLEGAQSATYYLLMLQGKEFAAIPAGSWYNFNKVAQYKQLTLEEAEEKMKNRRKTADGYQRWMMKAANNGAAAFGEVEKFDDKESGAGGGRGRRKTSGDEEENNASDRGEEDEEEEEARKSRLGLNKRSGDDDEEGPRGGDLDMDDDDAEKGDDWEHEEIFTDDDEAVAIDPEEREDLAPEIPAPPEIKQDEEDEDETNEEEEGGLSKSGKELKKLLGRTGDLDDSDAEDDDDDDDLEDDTSPVLAPKQKDAPKEEPVDNSPLKQASSGSARGTPTTSKSKGKRKTNGDDVKASNIGAPPKKVKTENDVKPSKEEIALTSKSSVPTKVAAPSSSKMSTPSSSNASKIASTASSGPVTEDEIRAVLMQKTPVTTQDLVAKFKSRLKTKEVSVCFSCSELLYHWYHSTRIILGRDDHGGRSYGSGAETNRGGNSTAEGQRSSTGTTLKSQMRSSHFEDGGPTPTTRAWRFLALAEERLEIKAGVQMFQPSNISQAIGLARLQEETIEAIIRRARQPFKPTNSGWPPSTTPTMAIPKLTTTTGDEEDENKTNEENAEDEDDNEDVSLCELTKLRQVSTVRVYQERFEELGSRTTGLTEEFIVSFFVSGLKEEIKAGVQMFQPSNISQAIGLARLQEETIEAIIRRARQPFKPTNSGWPPSTTPTMAIPKLTTTTGVKSDSKFPTANSFVPKIPSSSTDEEDEKKTNEEDAEDEDDNEDMEDDTSPVLAPKQKDAPKEEPSYNSPLKQASSGSARGTPTTSKSKGKRKTNGDDVKASNKVAPPKKQRQKMYIFALIETCLMYEVKPSKEEIALTSESSVRCMLTKVAAPSSSKTTSTASSSNASKITSTASCAGPFTEHEIRAVLMQKTPVTTRDLVGKFKSRLKRKEVSDKDAFAALLRRISTIRKTNGPNYVVYG
ncbi:hypothetical protein RHGRI_004344 [Rhododendron griersonianum]|uniref:Transcription initiation factor IIF subunit alpha n=1 Tax=Rhododendron griersonianum TaxID=479676 RepID=A0AAV6L8A4_9ERIC|nr:hypothetical protein RHGRI_004344 [Rhododendron griersonianum]